MDAPPAADSRLVPAIRILACITFGLNVSGLVLPDTLPPELEPAYSLAREQGTVPAVLAMSALVPLQTIFLLLLLWPGRFVAHTYVLLTILVHVGILAYGPHVVSAFDMFVGETATLCTGALIALLFVGRFVGPRRSGVLEERSRGIRV